MRQRWKLIFAVGGALVGAVLGAAVQELMDSRLRLIAGGLVILAVATIALLVVVSWMADNTALAAEEVRAAQQSIEGAFDQLAVGVRRDVRWVSSQLGLQVERLLLADVNAMESLDDDRTAQLLLNAEKEVCVLDLISDSGHWPDEAMNQGHANQLFDALTRRSADSSLPVYKRIVQVSDLEAALAGVKAPALIRHCRDMLELRRVRGHRVSLRVSARRFPFKFMLVDRSRVVLQLQEYDRAGDALKIWGEVLVADDRGEFVEIFREIWAEIDGDDRTRAMTAKDLPPP